MIVIVGLGNPGAQYTFTRHNAGFLAVDFARKAFQFPDFQTFESKSLISKSEIDGKKVIFLKPQTYMNLSGVAVLNFMNFYKISLDSLFVIHDDLDLPFLKLKIKKGGSHGGHKGLLSLNQHLGKDYTQFRIGIGRPPKGSPHSLISEYVLSPFLREEKQELEEFFFDFTKKLSSFLSLLHNK
jgi:PTH1 family peptidyl-tRNA hydrolase